MPTQPLRGWFLDEILELDSIEPGLAGNVFRGSDERRQVFSAYLASQRTRAIPAREKARILATSRHCAILGAAFGDVPQGFRGALSRSGPQPFRKSYYRYLHALLSANSRPEMRVFLSTADRLSPLILAIARQLPPALRRYGLAGAMTEEKQARDLADLFHLFVSHGLPEEPMTNSLAKMRSRRQVRDFARRWALRLSFPAHPVPASPNYRPITGGQQLRDMGRAFGNCMHNYIVEVLDERSSFAIAEWGENAAIVHLRKRGGSWLIEDVYGPNNDAPDPNVERCVESYLKGYDIHREPLTFRARKWSPLIRIAAQPAPVLFED